MTREQGILHRCGQELFEDQTMVRNCLKIFVEGVFWWMQYAHAELQDDNLRRSNERGNRLNFDFPGSIGDIEQRSMVSLGPLDPAGVILCSG